jgi:cysteinylglycine-S-conjugate dipeptidase
MYRFPLFALGLFSMVIPPSKAMGVVSGSNPSFCPSALAEAAKGSVSDVLRFYDDHLTGVAREELAALVAVPSESEAAQFGAEAEAERAAQGSVGNGDVAPFVLTKEMSRGRGHLQKAAELAVRMLQDAGLANAQIESWPEQGPYVTATTQLDPSLPTVLFYGHIDVVGEGDATKWLSDPFTLTERSGRYYGRGAADNKGGFIAFVMALRAFKESGRPLPVNVKVVVETGEEVGSSLLPYLEAHRERFATDVVMILDGENRMNHTPAITTSTRGFMKFQISYQVADSEMHSGAFGGAVPSPIKALNRALTALEDGEGRVLLPSIQDLESKASQGAVTGGMSDEMYRSIASLLPQALLSGGGNAAFRVARLASLNYPNVESDAGPKISKLPGKAWTTVSLRTIPGMEYETVLAELTAHMKAHNPHSMAIEVSGGVGALAWSADAETPVIATGAAILGTEFGNAAVYVEDGASLPLLGELSVLVSPERVVVFGVTDPDSNIHGPNEFMDIKTFQDATRASIVMLEAFGQMGSTFTRP